MSTLLIKTGNSDVLCFWIVIEPSPAWAAIPRALGTGISPDRSVIVALVDVRTVDGDLLRLTVVAEHLPAWATVAAARGAGVTPDAPVVVHLE